MKRTILILTTICLLMSITGCGTVPGRNTVSFYYPRDPEEKVTGPVDTFCAAEAREAAGSTADLSYLLSLYLGGPVDDSLISPFPEGTRLLGLQQREDRLFIELSGEFSQLSDMDLTIACACISLTCFELAGDITQVTVLSPETELYSAVSITMTRDSLTLTDTAAPAASQSQ